MKNILTKLGNGIVAGATSLGLLAAPVAAQSLDGWLEVSAGQPTPNIRAYPSLKLSENLTLQSLIDNNGYYPFSKTDLKDEVMKTDNFSIGLVATLNTDSDHKWASMGPNLSYDHEKLGYGFFELSLDLSNWRESLFYSYSGIPTKLGNFGMFTFTPISDIKSTYTEIEATGNSFGESGISPYMRTNFIGDKFLGYQAGVSVAPRKTIGWLKGKGHRARN